MLTTINTYSIIAKNLNPSLSSVEFGETKIVFDSGSERNFDYAGPAEILCSSFAACTLKNLEQFLILFYQRLTLKVSFLELINFKIMSFHP